MADAGEQLARVAVREHMASTQKELRRQAAEEANHELETKNHELEERATRDALTGLYNRTYFADALNAAIKASARAASPIGVVFCDIDHFKILNDTYGHQFGDDVLRHVAQIFYEVLRKSDVIARYGGEEFVVLVHQPTEKGLEKLSERLRQAIESGAFWFEGKRVIVTISIGAAIILPERDPGDLALRLVAAADEAMYESKQNGRNQVHVRSLIEAEDRQLSQLIAQKRFSRWLVQNKVFDIQVMSRALLETPAERLRTGSLGPITRFPHVRSDRRNPQAATGDGRPLRTLCHQLGSPDRRPARHPPGDSNRATQPAGPDADYHGSARQSPRRRFVGTIPRLAIRRRTDAHGDRLIAANRSAIMR